MDFTAVDTVSWLTASVTMAVGVLIALVVGRAVRSAAKPLRLQREVAHVVARISRVLVLTIAVVIALNMLGVEVGPLIGALGIGGVLIAMSLQPVLGNLVGSVMLQAQRPIRVGDQIQSNGHSGTVIEINGRSVELLTFNGEILHLPNLRVLDEPLVNQTRDEYRRTLLPFQVSYDADLRMTQKLLTSELRNLPGLEGAPPADVLVTGFGDSGIDLVARIWHPSEELSSRWLISESAITIRETLDRHDIEIPFPQRVVHVRGGSDVPLPPGDADA